MARITVEDCLEVVQSRFALVHVASQRARRLIKGARPLIKTDNKLIVTALREIAAGLVTVDQVLERKHEAADDAAAHGMPEAADALAATDAQTREAAGE